MLFENVINDKENNNKSIDKHIKLNPTNNINLNAIQTVLKIEYNEYISFNDLINICIMEFVKQTNNIVLSGNESEAINYINNCKNEYKQGGF